MHEPSFYWHDYETWGATPSIDRPSQFAGLRTNLALEPVAEPDVWFCKPTVDVLPHPDAVLITGITPLYAEKQGLSEPEFMQAISQQMAAPNTCSAGYNSLRFDDEVTRYGLYRNFYDPYEREWKNGNSRWDLIDMVRTCYALRPEGVEWPMVDGVPSFKLESLAAANNLLHSKAHDALSDVEATIALARKIKMAQPKLYEYLFNARLKNNVAQAINVFQRKPFLHISSKYPSVNGCAALVVPLAIHPTNKNAVLVFDLSQDPTDLISLSAQKIAERVFTRTADLPEGEGRIGLKAVHLNKCPVVLTPKLLTDKNAERLHIDKTKCERHWQQLLMCNLADKVAQIFALSSFDKKPDAEQQLYDGFLPPADKPLLNSVRSAAMNERMEQSFYFNDSRYNALLLRYKARHFPQALNDAEQAQWQEICKRRWFEGVPGYLTLSEFDARTEVLCVGDISASQASLLRETQSWVHSRVKR